MVTHGLPQTGRSQSSGCFDLLGGFAAAAAGFVSAATCVSALRGQRGAVKWEAGSVVKL